MKFSVKLAVLVGVLVLLCALGFFVTHSMPTPFNIPVGGNDQYSTVSESRGAVNLQGTPPPETKSQESLSKSRASDPAIPQSTSMPSASMPIALEQKSDEPKPKVSGLGLYVLPDRTNDRMSEHIEGEYLCGMPIVLSVRLVNLAAKHNELNASPIKISRLWADDLRFDVTLSSRSVETFKIKPSLKPQERDAEPLLEIFKTDLDGIWVVEAETTATLEPGLYRIAPSFCGVSATPILIKIAKSSSPESHKEVMIQKARALYRTLQYEKAIEIADKAMLDGGYLVSDNGKHHVILVSAASHEALGHYEGALALYKKFKAGAPEPKPHPGMGVSLVDVKIAELEKLLQK